MTRIDKYVSALSLKVRDSITKAGAFQNMNFLSVATLNAVKHQHNAMVSACSKLNLLNIWIATLICEAENDRCCV